MGEGLAELLRPPHTHFPRFHGGRRQAEGSVKQNLWAADVRYGLLFPARLQIKLNNNKHIFNTPEADETFYKEKIAPARPGTDVKGWLSAHSPYLQPKPI